MWEDTHFRHKYWHERWPIRILIGFVVLLLVLCILPYFFPLSAAEDLQSGKPFANSQFVIASGVALHCRIWNPQSDQCQGKILLIHGLGASTYSWEQTADSLSQAGYWVIAVDLPGFGYSSRQTGIDHSQKQRSQLVWQLLQTFENQIPDQAQNQNWTLIGHSMGAGTVAAMALAEPELTAQLVLVDGALLDMPQSITTALIRFPPAARWLSVILENLVIQESNIHNILGSAYLSDPTPEQAQAYLQPLLISGTARALTDLVLTAKNESAAALKEAAFPIDAIWGESDPVIPVSQSLTLKQMIPALNIRTIAGAGHVPMETHHDAFSKILLEILQKPDA